VLHKVHIRQSRSTSAENSFDAFKANICVQVAKNKCCSMIATNQA